MAFLPFGAEAYFQAQRKTLPSAPCVLVLPDEFCAEARNRLKLRDDLGLLPQPEGLSDSQMVADALRRAATVGPVQLLLGDALVWLRRPPEDHLDIVAVGDERARTGGLVFDPHAEAGARFSAGSAELPDGASPVCGYFQITDHDLMIRACDSGSLLSALNAYDLDRPFESLSVEEWASITSAEAFANIKSRRLVSRGFNSVTRDGDRVVKRSADALKIEAEARWYETLPQSLRSSSARYLGRANSGDMSGYSLEYLAIPTLSELSVFGRLPGRNWETIIASSFTLLQRFQGIRPEPGQAAAAQGFSAEFYQAMYVDKTRQRLDTYLAARAEDEAPIVLNGRRYPPVREVAEQVLLSIRPTRPEDIRFWHGDFHYGNLFYNANSREVLCIDPRGQLEGGQITAFGDLRYDVAKLAHSVIGRYDRILLGGARLEVEGPACWRLDIRQLPEDAAADEQFLQLCHATLGLEGHEILSMTALLFFSMLPLHRERPDLQRMFLATGLLLAGRSGALE